MFAATAESHTFDKKPTALSISVMPNFALKAHAVISASEWGLGGGVRESKRKNGNARRGARLSNQQPACGNTGDGNTTVPCCCTTRRAQVTASLSAST